MSIQRHHCSAYHRIPQVVVILSRVSGQGDQGRSGASRCLLLILWWSRPCSTVCISKSNSFRPLLFFLSTSTYLPTSFVVLRCTSVPVLSDSLMLSRATILPFFQARSDALCAANSLLWTFVSFSSADRALIDICHSYCLGRLKVYGRWGSSVV